MDTEQKRLSAARLAEKHLQDLDRTLELLRATLLHGPVVGVGESADTVYARAKYHAESVVEFEAIAQGVV